jgi:hypothetical protein
MAATVVNRCDEIECRRRLMQHAGPMNAAAVVARFETEHEHRERRRGEACARHRRELLLPTGNRLRAVEGLGLGSVSSVMLSRSPSFTPVSIPSPCHQEQRSGTVVRFAAR